MQIVRMHDAFSQPGRVGSVPDTVSKGHFRIGWLDGLDHHLTHRTAGDSLDQVGRRWDPSKGTMKLHERRSAYGQVPCSDCFLHEMKPRSGRVEGGWSAGRGAVHGIEASDGLKCKKVAPWRPIYLHVNKEDLTEGIYLQSVGRRARNLFCSRKGDLTPGKWIPCTVQIKRRGEKFDLTPSLRYASLRTHKA